MGFPSSLVGQKASETSGSPRDPSGVVVVLSVIGAFFVAATIVGLFFGFAAFIGVRTYTAFNTFFPGR